MKLWRFQEIAISRDVVPHALLGEAHAIEHAGRTITAMSAIDWDRPTRIPVVAEPARLPPGAGGALLNAIAERAARAGVPALRYAGPYPTPALYRALLRSFRASADEATFTCDVLDRALRLARDEVPVEFAPAPHHRVEHAHGHAELRDGLEAAVVGGTRFERGASVARLDGGVCSIWFGDATWAHIAELDTATGALVAGPHPPPRVDDPIVGRAFPPELRAALAELVAEVVPAPLAADARTVVSARPIVWADLGTRAARRGPTGFQVHAALWARVAPHGLSRLALALAEALAPVVTSAILAEVVLPLNA
ncbi:MAG TPA: hypothetical protein VGF94_14185 [Kofleriaceae bacterium]